jgi:hypothetical protein
MKRLTLLVLSIIVACSLRARAQTIQTTWQQNAFTNASAAGPSVIFRNVNQASHWLSYCETGGPAGFTIQLEQSADGISSWQAISAVGTADTLSNGCGLLWAGGYYFAVRANITLLSGGTNPRVTATYTASTAALEAPPNLGQNFSSQVMTYNSIGNCSGGDEPELFANNGCASGLGVYQVMSAGTVLFPSGKEVFYGATLYNPNSVTVFFGFYDSNVGGSIATNALIVMAVPAGQSLVMNLPVQGVSVGLLAINCSTSLTSNVDPASNCVFTPFTKPAFSGNGKYNNVPN